MIESVVCVVTSGGRLMLKMLIVGPGNSDQVSVTEIAPNPPKCGTTSGLPVMCASVMRFDEPTTDTVYVSNASEGPPPGRSLKPPWILMPRLPCISVVHTTLTPETAGMSPVAR